jgi:glutamate:GABA antiporter
MTTDEMSPTSQDLRREEARVESRSAILKKELGVANLTLTQILFIVGLPWVGVAAKQGPSHVVLWLFAVLLFYIPSAVVVIHLNRIMPLEGGLYQWAKLGINEPIGFLVAWNLWLFAILNTSELGLQVTQYLSYVVGPGGEWITGSKLFVGSVSLLLIAGLVWLTTVGFSIGKWVHTAGGILMLLTFSALVILPFVNYSAGSVSYYNPLRTERPLFSLMSLNLLGKMGFGAFGGFEYVAIHAGECRDPVRSIGRSVALAAPAITVMFILGTSSVLALVPQDQIDLIAPIPQVLSHGFGLLGFGQAIAPVAILALLCIRVAQASVMFSGTSRLPMVAGWDQLLPEWFTRLHGKNKTPVNSIIFVGAVTFTLGVVGLIGVGRQEAFQLLWNASGIFYALTYLAMFALPIIGIRSVRVQLPFWLKACAVSGFLMTLLFVTLGIVPIIRVESRLIFAAKISGLIVATNIVGIALFHLARRKLPSRQVSAGGNIIG